MRVLKIANGAPSTLSTKFRGTRMKNELVLQLAHKDVIIRELESKVQHQNSIQSELANYQELASSLENECKTVTEKCRSLNQRLEYKDRLLTEEKQTCQRKDDHIKELRVQLQLKSKSCDEEHTLHCSSVQLLQAELSRLKAELIHKEEKNLSILQELEQCKADLLVAQRQQVVALTSSSGTAENISNDDAAAAVDEGTVKIVKSHELTEKDLLECKKELERKSEEVVGLRSLHDQRLERMQALELDYKLLSDQLHTYETNSKKKRSQDKRRSLRHEDSDKVWNELTRYKSECNELKKQMLHLEEERDVMQAKSLRNQTTIAELRANLHHQNNDMERKLLAIATVESFTSEDCASQDDIKYLQMRVEELTQENKQTSKEKRELEKGLKVHREELVKLQSMVSEMERNMHVKKDKKLCKLVRTEVSIAAVSRVDASVQVSLPVKKATVKDAQVSTQMSDNCDSSGLSVASTQARHRRTYSDGETIVQKRMSQTVYLNPKSTALEDGDSLRQVEKVVSLRRPLNKVHATREGHAHGSSQRTSREQGHSHHQCVWQHKARSLQQRLKAVSEQVSALTKTKLSLSQCLDDSNATSEKAKKDVKELMLRLEGHRSALNSLHAEKQVLQETVVKQEKTIADLRQATAHVGKRPDVDWKRLEEEQKGLHSKCLALKATVKSLEEHLQQKTTEVACMKESTCRAERDLKQKRQLIEDLKNKLKREKDSSTTIQEKLRTLSEKATSLADVVDQQKHKMETQRSQLSHQVAHKDRLMEMLKSCQKELEHSIKQLNSSQDLHKQHKKQAAQTELGLKVRLEELEKRHQDELRKTECRLGEMEETVQEFTTFTTDLARDLFYHYHGRKGDEQEYKAKDKGHIYGRVREIARSALKMSEVDLDDFFGEDQQDESCEHERLRQFMNLVKSTARSKPPFAAELLKTFTDMLYN